MSEPKAFKAAKRGEHQKFRNNKLVLEPFFEYARKREQIRIDREGGQHYPWTETRS